MPKKLDLTGQRFGRLTVISFGEHRRSKSGASKRYWLCKCDCGNECLIITRSLTHGNSKSCGCYKKERDKNQKKHCTHGQSKTRLYKIWVDMKRRCNDEWRKAYKYYGGRGIKYAEEWENFEPFRDWSLSNGYADDLTLDRIDNNGNYEPTNCRWVSYETQANNTRRNHKITYNGKTQNLSEWAREYNIPYGVLRDRINRLHWDMADALTIPVSSVNRSHKNLTFNGKTQNIEQWSKELGLSRRTITNRLKMGIPIEQVLSKGHMTKGKLITFNGETHNIKEWAEITGIFEGVLAYRIRQNWDIEDVFNTPVGTVNNYETSKEWKENDYVR